MLHAADTSENIPIVVRFGKVQYDREDYERIQPLVASYIIVGDTHPTTYSATTRGGDDNDSDDTGSDD